MQRHGAWKSASRHSAVRAVGRFTAKLTKRKFAFHHSGRRGVALIAAISWHFGSTRASKSASHGPSILSRNQHGARCSRQNRRGAANPSRALAQKPGTDHDFLGKFGADLCGPEHLAKNPFPQSRVFSAKQARTCADPSIQTRNYGGRFCRQNRRGPCSGLLGITKVTIGTYPNWSSKPSIPCRSRAPSLAIVWGEGGVRIK